MKFTSNVGTMRPFINYAHRGASEYAPENTVLSFMLGVKMGANGIETDVQKTKDGVLVLFHDDTLERVMGQVGSVKDYTYAELKKFWVSGKGLFDKIVKFDDFLRQFGGLKLAIELKVEGVYKDVVDTINSFGIKDNVVLTSFIYDEVKRAKEYAPDFKVGYLTWDYSDKVIDNLLRDGFYEICPIADNIEKSDVDKWHSLGFNVRAWGVKNEELMRHAYDIGVDGMTVNFPDKLVDYIASKITTVK